MGTLVVHSENKEQLNALKSILKVLKMDFEATTAQMSLKEWKEAERKIRAFEIAQGIKQALKEVEKIQKGEIKSKTIWEVLDEL